MSTRKHAPSTVAARNAAIYAKLKGASGDYIRRREAQERLEQARERVIEAARARVLTTGRGKAENLRAAVLRLDALEKETP